MKMHSRQQRIGISVVSILHLLQFGRAGKVLEPLGFLFETGYDGFQLVPVRGLAHRHLTGIGKNTVISYEGDWRMQPPAKQSFASKAICRLVFGSKTRTSAMVCHFNATFPQALAIDLGRDSAVEISPRSGLTYEDYICHRGGVVFDTLHAVEQFGYTAALYRLISALLDVRQIRLIHFQTRNRAELGQFLSGKDCALVAMLRRVLQSGADVIVELPPHLVLFGGTKLLKAVRTRLRQLIVEVQVPDVATVRP